MTTTTRRPRCTDPERHAVGPGKVRAICPDCSPLPTDTWRMYDQINALRDRVDARNDLRARVEIGTATAAEQQAWSFDTYDDDTSTDYAQLATLYCALDDALRSRAPLPSVWRRP